MQGRIAWGELGRGKKARFFNGGVKFSVKCADEAVGEKTMRGDPEQSTALLTPAENSAPLAPRDTPDRREQLILAHLPQVRLIARRVFKRIPDSANFEDLVSAGVLGLIAAIDRYDSRRDVKLRTYAEHKIRGAILDSLREMDWIPRHQRKRRRQIEIAISVLKQEFQRTPDEEEIAAYLHLSVAEYQEWLSESRSVSIGSLELASVDGEGGDLLRYLADSEQSWPSEVVERAQLKLALTVAIERLPTMDRTVLSLYYYEEMTLREIAEILDLHESRISHLKTQAVLRLRALMTRRRCA